MSFFPPIKVTGAYIRVGLLWTEITVTVLFSFYRCQPVYCKYKFYKQPEHISVGREHGKHIYWDDINVVLAGNYTIIDWG